MNQLNQTLKYFLCLVGFTFASASFAVTNCPSGNPKACFETKTKAAQERDKQHYADELHKQAHKTIEQAEQQTDAQHQKQQTNSK